MTVGGGGDFLSLAWSPPRSEELAVGALVGANPTLKVDGAGVFTFGGAPNENGNGVGVAGPPRFPELAPNLDEAVLTSVDDTSGGLIDTSGASGVACGKEVVDS